MKRIRSILLVSAALAAAGTVWAQDRLGRPAPAPTVKLGIRYTDELRGFSLRPPADVERVREASPHRLAGWIRRDQKAATVRWSLEVLRIRQQPTKLPLAEYAKTVAAKLAQSDNFKVRSTRIGTVAGKPAMHFRGAWSGALKLWRRQSWVQTEPGVYLVLNISGPETDQAEMDAVLTAVANSLKLFDPKAALAERRENLKRGKAIIKGLSDKRLAALTVSTAQYFTISVSGKSVGFLRITESIITRGGATGLRVVRGGSLKSPGAPKQLVREELFATADRKAEQWQRLEEIPSGISIQDAIKQGQLLLVQTVLPGKPRESHKKELPGPIREAYLPQALGAVVARLVDRTKPGGWAFAVYSPARQSFEMRTVRVVGPDLISLGGRKVLATRLTDQMASDAPIASLWVNEKGRILRMRAAGGVTMELADKNAIITQFAADLVEIDKLPEKVKDRYRYKPGWQ